MAVSWELQEPIKHLDSIEGEGIKGLAPFGLVFLWMIEI